MHMYLQPVSNGGAGASGRRMNQDNQEDEHDLKWKDGGRKKVDWKGKDASQRGKSSFGYTGRNI